MTSEGRTSSFTISMVWPTFVGSSQCPCSSSETSSSKKCPRARPRGPRRLSRCHGRGSASRRRPLRQYAATRRVGQQAHHEVVSGDEDLDLGGRHWLSHEATRHSGVSGSLRALALLADATCLASAGPGYRSCTSPGGQASRRPPSTCRCRWGDRCRVRADVQHQARATFGKAFGSCDSAWPREHFREQLTVVGGYLGGVDDALFRDHQDVCRRDGMQVPERVDEVSRQHLGRGPQAGDDGAEEAARACPGQPASADIVSGEAMCVVRGRRPGADTATSFARAGAREG